MTYLETYQTLINSQEFKDWKKKFPRTYLSHFYCQLTPDFKQKTPWEIGFYDKKNDKIAIFQTEPDIKIKPEEEVFKKEGTVEELDLKKVRLDFQQALKTFQKVKQKHYPSEILLNGFAILQFFQNNTLWNLSFAAKSLGILNIKINAENQEVISHQMVNFIERKAS